MKSVQFLSLAMWLNANKKCVEGFRSSIGRAYYSSFHSTLEFLAEMGIIIPRTENKHEKAPDLLESTGDALLRQAAEKLRQLRDHRKIADYELLNLDPENESFALLRAGEAAQIIGALDTCLKTKGTRGGRFEKAKTAAEQRRQFLLFGPGASGS